MENILEHKTLSFKDVHLELERENSLLLKEHNLSDFTEKSDFLKAINFNNSKATKLYSAIIESEEYRKDFNKRHHGMYKFILPEQLERVCEKYNLFVRDVNDFCGDIPEKNIKDMMNFKFSAEDIFSITDNEYPVLRLLNSQPDKNRKITIQEKRMIENDILDNAGIQNGNFFRLESFKDIMEKVFKSYANKYFNGNIDRRAMGAILSQSRLVIAAIPSLFRPSAFESDNTRLGNDREELEATGQVDLDPIVMLKNNHGYIIITAWGDEANDELVVNQNLN